MKYFGIEVSSEPRIIGVNNGIYQMEIDPKSYVSKKAYESATDLIRGYGQVAENYHKLSQDEIPFKVLKSAKITDFMCFSPYLMNSPFAISETALNIFKQFNIKPFYSLKLKFTNRTASQPYYLFFYPFTEFEDVDFPSSIMFKRYGLSEKKYYTINNLEEYRLFSAESGDTRFDVLGLKKTQKEFDFLSLRIDGSYVSEKLKDALVYAECTGLEFKERTKLQFV